MRCKMLNLVFRWNGVEHDLVMSEFSENWIIKWNINKIILIKVYNR